MRFAVPAAVAAIAGAMLLGLLAEMLAIARYEALDVMREVHPIKLVIGAIIVTFALLELSPRFAALTFPPQYLPLGGLLSGFFGGLSGNQGAFRSAFLIKAGLDKEAFVATGVIAAIIVDTVRLAVYGFTILCDELWGLNKQRGRRRHNSRPGCVPWLLHRGAHGQKGHVEVRPTRRRSDDDRGGRWPHGWRFVNRQANTSAAS